MIWDGDELLVKSHQNQIQTSFLLYLAEDNIYESVYGHVCVHVCPSFKHSYIIGWKDRAAYIRPPLYGNFFCVCVCLCDGAGWRELKVTLKQLLGHFSLITKMPAWPAFVRLKPPERKWSHLCVSVPLLPSLRWPLPHLSPVPSPFIIPLLSFYPPPAPRCLE